MHLQLINKERTVESVGIQIGPMTIPYYGLFIALGVLAAGSVGYYQTRRYQMDFNDFASLGGAAGLGALLGAKILYLIVLLPAIDYSRLLEVEYLKSLLAGGFVFYGGLAGGFAGVILCGKILNVDTIRYIQIDIPVLPFAHAFGRIGCLLTGCCYGIPYSGLGAITYRESLFAPNQTPLFPVQGIEAGAELLLSILLFVYIRRTRGKLLSIEIYLKAYSVIRFVLEFFRYDNVQRGMFGGLSTSQWISIALFTGVIFYGRREKNVLSKLRERS